jgi:predicted DNA-binding transcriptional regulator AlpA
MPERKPQSRENPSRQGLEPLLTVADLERLFQVHRRTIIRMCQGGKLPQPLKIGGSNRWRVDDIEHALAKFASKKNEN